MEIDSGNTAWMLAASALVLFMTPGLAFFYGGLTRNKNVLATIMQSFICIGIVSVLWVTVGYSLAFGPDQGLGLIGNFDHIGLKDVGVEGPGIPPLIFVSFQMMFAIITPALITGAFAERAKFGPFLIFIALWSLLVYVPVAHWVFATDGWLSAFSSDPEAPDIGLNSLDFAGGLAIHVNAGVAALAAVFVFGKRKGYGSEPMEPHDITMVVLGASILWFGWFGFNAGSALGATGQAVYAFINTNVAAAAAALTWALLAWQHGGKPSVVGAAAGAVAGLVAVTPASGYVEPMEALAIGIGAGVLCYIAVQVRVRIKLDDSLDVVGVHGVGGIWGALATGLFANSEVSGIDFADGLFHGNPQQLWDQSVGIVGVALFSFIVTFLILKVLDMTMGVRVTESDEELGLDVTQHGERAYHVEEGGMPATAILPAPPATYTD
jgi:Amt family ammonium transporter